MNKFKTLSSGLLLAAVLGLSNQAQALTIDTFDTTAQSLSGTSGTSGPIATAPGEAIGDFRKLSILSTTPSGIGSTSMAVDSLTNPNAFNVNNGAGVTSVTAVTWGAQVGGLGGIDLTDGGASTALLLAISFIDQGAVSIKFDIKETNDQPGGDTASLTLSGLGLGTQTFLFSSFTNFANVNFTSIGRITMTVTAGNASDLVLDLVETNQDINLPEPSSLVLMGLGLAGLSFLRKRKAA